MKAKTILLSALVSFLLLAPASFAQNGNWELGAQVGGQLNGGIDLSTTLFKRLEAGNALSYGATLGRLMGEHAEVEFQWTRGKTDARAQPLLGGSSIKVFNMTQDHYLGNFLMHFTSKEAALRPYLSVGLGANDISVDRPGISGSTRFTFALGGGAKYYPKASHIGFRGQLQWVPTYLYSTNNGGYWCDPIWGGCWLVGQDHYLHSFNVSAGITFRF